MKRRGFTLIELIIVIIIIGVLATLAIPQYLKAVEKGKLAKGKAGLALLAQAEGMYRAEKDTYTSVLGNAAGTTGLNSMVELGKIRTGNDGDWTYSITSATATAFTAQAVRNSPSPCGGSTVTLNETGTWNGIPGSPAATSGCASWR